MILFSQWRREEGLKDAKWANFFSKKNTLCCYVLVV